MKKIQSMAWRGVVLTTLGMLAVLIAARPLQAQQQGDADRSQLAGMEHLSGEIAAVSATTLTVKNEQGELKQVVTTTNTRITKGRGNAVKLSDLKVGDGVMAMGNLDGPSGTMHAAMVFATDAANVKALRENLGKTYITGKVTAIDTGNATLTIERPDHVVQTIGLDETTSFRRGGRIGGQGAPSASGTPSGMAAPGAGPGGDAGESITLGDIQVGDRIHATGALKAGVFVPGQLTVLPADAGPGVHRRGTVAGAGAGPA
jgi:hypothetical protein